MDRFEIPVYNEEDLTLHVACWDKDRFKKDYMGEVSLNLDDIFANEKTAQSPTWYTLESRSNRKKKDSVVSGEIQLQFTLTDPSTPGATPQQVMEKFKSIAVITPTKSLSDNSQTGEEDEDEEALDAEEDEVTDDEIEDPSKPEEQRKRGRMKKVRGLKKRKAHRLYEFMGSSDVVGVVYLEISSVTDLPPEKNLTRTSFDMDPFVVASLGRKTYRTRVIRHKLNPVFNEKMIFPISKHEQGYSIAFTVMDRDKLSGNDFICATSMPLPDIIATAPKSDPETGLYDLPELPEASTMPKPSKSRFKISISRTNSSQSVSKMRPSMTPRTSSFTNKNASQAGSLGSQDSVPSLTVVDGKLAADVVPPAGALDLDPGQGAKDENGDPDLKHFDVPLKLKNLERWEEKHKPELHIRAKYVPYPALRQQFWRSMLKQYDVDESGTISKVELTTMLDTLGSTLKDSTINSFFKRFPHMIDDEEGVLTYDEAVICLEDQLKLRSEQNKSAIDKMRDTLQRQLSPSGDPSTSTLSGTDQDQSSSQEDTNLKKESSTEVAQQTVVDLGTPGEEGEAIQPDDLNDNGKEEHVVEIRECPICHQPRLNKRSDTDIITHIATCASQDWRQVNNIVMGGFVTSSQAQRKWYSKVITKVSYGGYKLGANSANILVQDRITGQINEERMSVYVRLGIRLLYKGLKSREMERKRIRKLLKGLSIKQGIKYDDPASRHEIPKFIAFHQLDLTEVAKPLEEYKTFNEFFYRALKPGARPCSAPDNPRIVVSPADCRTVVFNRLDVAQKIWVKGRDFSIKRLLADAYPEDVERYSNGALGIFRLAPQDYHRFHVPVDGIMGKPKTIEGEYYTVNPMAIRSALDVYGENVRVCVPIDSPEYGRVMVICVGAMMVGSTVITRKEGEEVKRAEELGYFKFGGSTLLVLFEDGRMRFDGDLVENSESAVETLVSYIHPS
jgi:phosphatidylserine decarboxylase